VWRFWSLISGGQALEVKANDIEDLRRWPRDALAVDANGDAELKSRDTLARNPFPNRSAVSSCYRGGRETRRFLCTRRRGDQAAPAIDRAGKRELAAPRLRI